MPKNARHSKNYISTYTSGTPSIYYNPYRLWKLLKESHCSISESCLNLVSKALQELKESWSETFSVYIDWFETVLTEFLKFGGKLYDTQSAQLLIVFLKPGYKVTTVAIIYRTVQPLTLSTVASVLREANAEAGISSIPIIQASVAANSIVRRVYPSRREKCTLTKCLGPHEGAKYFSKPENTAKREKWISEKEDECNGTYRTLCKSTTTI